MRLRNFYILPALFVVIVSAQAQQQASLSRKKIPDRNSTYSLLQQENDDRLYGCNWFINKSAFAVKDSTVCFFLRNHTEAKKVFLSGNFCNWNPAAWSMTKTDSGWIALVKLPAGRYLYKFIIDGNWNTDVDNLLMDEQHLNSIYYKTNAVF